MKITTLFLLITFTCSISFAQINIGDKRHPNVIGGPGDLEQEDLNNFKNTTTILVLPSKESKRLEEYKKAVKQGWTYSKMEVITNDQIEKYKSGNYSYITIAGIIIQRKEAYNPKASIMSTANYFLYVFYPKPNKKGKIKPKSMARIELYLDTKTSQKAVLLSNNEDDAEDYVSSTDALFYNLNPGLLKCYLTKVNACFKKTEKRLLFDKEIDKTEMKKLNKDTLFIPSYVLNKMGVEDGSKLNEKELMEDYPFPYKFLSDEQLSAKILNATKNTYVLSYIFCYGEKYFAIYEGKTGAMIYADYETMSMKGINSGDFKDIAKKIK